MSGNLMLEVGIIAHSCGVSEVGSLQRRHAQIINSQGMPDAMDTVFPAATTRPEYLLAPDRD